jgi:hypothetical protein
MKEKMFFFQKKNQITYILKWVEFKMKWYDLEKVYNVTKIVWRVNLKK